MKQGFAAPLMLILLFAIGVCSATLFRTTLLWQRFARINTQQIALEQGAEYYFWQGVKQLRNNPKQAASSMCTFTHTYQSEVYQGSVTFTSVDDDSPAWLVTAQCKAPNGIAVKISAHVTLHTTYVEVTEWQEVTTSHEML